MTLSLGKTTREDCQVRYSTDTATQITADINKSSDTASGRSCPKTMTIIQIRDTKGTLLDEMYDVWYENCPFKVRERDLDEFDPFERELFKSLKQKFPDAFGLN